MRKPSILYHTSPQKGLKKLEPQRTISQNKYIGDFVFTTANPRLAAMYLAPKGYATLMAADTKPPSIVICADEQKYLLHDKGGAIYQVASSNFQETPQAGLEKYEFVSKSSTTIIKSKTYKSSLEAMAKVGIKVYFVEEPTFNNLIRNPRQKELIAKLSPYRPK